MTNRHPLANCSECPWNVPQAGYAPVAGPEDAPILLIGESPGRGEKGVPFKGPVGYVVNLVLGRNKIAANKVRMTNVVACHPPHEFGEESDAPPAEVIACCKPRLEEELKGRTAIVGMGNIANKAIQDKTEGITKARKRAPSKLPQDHRLAGTIYVATVNPGACIRTPDYFKSFNDDIIKLKRALTPNNIYTRWEPTRYAVADDEVTANKVLESIYRNAEMLSLDIECGVDKDVNLAHPDELLCIGISYEENKSFVIGEQALKFQSVRDWLSRILNKLKIICHNGKYDLQVLMRFGGFKFRPRLYADTMIANYCMDERPGHHDLESVASQNLGTPSWKAELEKYLDKGDSYAVIPRDVLYRYNAYDAAETFKLWRFLEKKLTPKLRALHDRLMLVSDALTYVELDGILVDDVKLAELAEEYEAILADLEEGLSRWVDNPNSVKQVVEALDVLDLDNETTTKRHLNMLLRDVEEGTEAWYFLTLILHQRLHQKVYGTYIKGNQKRLINRHLHPSFFIHGTVSGRLACRNPNLQNQPRQGVKDIFIPKPGHIFVQCDYSQVELRVIACEAQDKYLQLVFKDPNRDIHGEVSNTLFGEGKWDSEGRVRAKSYVFGSIYGLSPYSISLDFGIPELKARREQNAFFRMIPDTMKWRRKVVSDLMSNGQIPETFFGRQRRLRLITKETEKKLAKEVLAFYPQSTANDICMDAMNNISKAFEDTSARLRVPVHDSITVECPIEDAKEVGQIMRNIMEQTATNTYSDYVPFEAKAEYGFTLGQLGEVKEDSLPS